MKVFVDGFLWWKTLELPEFDGSADSLCRELRKLKLFKRAFHVVNDFPGRSFRAERRHWKPWPYGKERKALAIIYMVKGEE